MLKIRFSTRFKRDLKRVQKQEASGYDEVVFKSVVQNLQSGIPLDKKFEDHPLQEKYAGARECHLAPDLLLVYEVNNDVLELLLLRIGSHSNLFRR